MRLYKRGEIWWAVVYRTGVRERVSTHCQARRAAEIAARELERIAADPIYAAAQTKTVAGAVGLALDEINALVRTGRRSAGTQNYYVTKAGHLARLMGRVLLADLTAATLREYEHTRRAETATESTIAKERQVLRVGLRLALERQWWAGPVERVIARGFDAGYRPRTAWLTEPELQQLLVQLHADCPDRAARVAWIVATGARWAESVVARREDIAKDHTAVRLRGTKTDAAVRVVPVVGPFRPLLEYAIEHATGSDGLMFESWTSPVLVLRRACRLAQVPRVTPNDLRRSTATWLVRAGVPDSIAARVLGHTTERMVRQVYGQADAAALGALVSARFPETDSVTVPSGSQRGTG